MPNQLELTLPRRIALVLLPGYTFGTINALLEPLKLANELSGTALYAPQVYAGTVDPIPSVEGMSISPDVTLSTRQQPHFVIVISGPKPALDGKLSTWLENTRRRGVCPRHILCAAKGPGAQLKYAPDTALESQAKESSWAANEVASTERPRVADVVCDLIREEHGEPLVRRIREVQLKNGHLPASLVCKIVFEAEVSSHSPRLGTAIKLMRSNVEQPLKLTELALRVGLSMRQLERLASEYLGCPPRAFYLKVRLEHSRFLIRETQCTLQQVASAIGFQSVNYFARRYREHFGLSPRRELAETGRNSHLNEG